jgi:hypothetical protein
VKARRRLASDRLVPGCWCAEIEQLRAHSRDGRALKLASRRTWNGRDPLEQRAIERMPAGVSKPTAKRAI